MSTFGKIRTQWNYNRSTATSILVDTYRRPISYFKFISTPYNCSDYLGAFRFLPNLTDHVINYTFAS